MKMNWIKRFKINRITISIYTGNYTEIDMYNAFKAGRSYQDSYFTADQLNKYCGEKAPVESPDFKEWMNEYKK